MRRKTGTRLVALLVSLLLALTMAGCAEKAPEKPRVSIYLRHPFTTQALMPFLTERFPNVELDFMVGDNGPDSLALLAEHGDLPDIFMLSGATKNLGELAPYCYNLEETDVAASVYNSYRSRYAYPDGSVYVLPTVGETSGMLANKTMFDKYDVAIPTDYESYIAACKAFEAEGLRGYAPDGKYPVSLATMMVCIGAEQITGVDGTKWMSSYESGGTDVLAPEVWLKVFEQTKQFVEDGGLDMDSVTANGKGYGYNDMWKGLREGTSAMIRGTVSSILNATTDDGVAEMIQLPWFAPDAHEDDAFIVVEAGSGVCAGISKAAMEGDKQHAELVMQVYETIYSQEALQLLVDSYGGGWFSFTNRASVELPHECENLQSYIDRNHLIIMVDNNIQEALGAGFRAMMLDGRTPEEALEDASAVLKELRSKTESVQEDILFESKSSYPARFDAKTGNAAASVIANTVREYLGADILINPYMVQNAPIYAMGYTATQLGDICAPGAYRVLLGEVSGEELLKIARASVEEDGYPDAPVSDGSLPVVSGGVISIRKSENGYSFSGLTVGGHPVDAGKSYYTAVIDYDGVPDRFATDIMRPMGLYDKFSIYKDNSFMRDVFVEAVESRGAFAEPSDYITLER